MEKIDELLFALVSELDTIENLDEKVDVLNYIRSVLHEHSPFREEPCDCVIWKKTNDVRANEYNPNHVATPEMKLLYESIKLDGYTMPIVTYSLGNGSYEIVDGFHRNRVGREHSDINKRIHGTNRFYYPSQQSKGNARHPSDV